MNHEPASVDLGNIGAEEQLRSKISSIQMLSLIVGVIALVVAIGAALMSGNLRELFYRAYLVAYAFWIGLALASGAIAMIHNLTAGRWGQAARRVIEAANATMPLMAVLSLPLLLAIHTSHMYAWAGFGPPVQLGAHKAAFLTPAAVTIRAVIYLSIWLATCFMIRTGANQVEATRSFAVARKFAAMSAVGLILYTLTMTGAIVDWMMSLTPDWYSTMYTLIFMMGQVLSAFCFAVLVTSLLIRYRPAAGKVSRDQFNDLGSFMFAFTVLWAYMSFSQLIISWMGNLKAEMTWYAHRNVGGWLIVGLGLMTLNFLLPFLLLMNKNLKRNPKLLMKVAAFIIVMRYMDLIYLVKPAFVDQRMSFMDILAPIGIGGLFMWRFLGSLKSRKLDPPPLVDERYAMELGDDHGGEHGILGATEYGAAISHRKGPVP